MKAFNMVFCFFATDVGQRLPVSHLFTANWTPSLLTDSASDSPKSLHLSAQWNSMQPLITGRGRRFHALQKTKAVVHQFVGRRRRSALALTAALFSICGALRLFSEASL